MTQFTANKKPLFDSDIDPKRIKSVADGLRRQDEFESARMLDGYAELLEAREKGVPVAYALFTEKGLIRMWSREWFADAHGAPVNPTPLYTHPAPSDAERLAEALRNLVSEWVAIADDDATLEDSTIGYRACANRLSAMLATHSAQAQPPAASVPGVSAQAHENAQAALAAQENPNG